MAKKKKIKFKPTLSKDISRHNLTAIERLTNVISGRESTLARSVRIFGEARRGLNFLKQYKKSATFFGSARSHLPEKMYKEATKLANMLSQDGYAILTGGGGGIMEAANKGAFEAGGSSVGLNIELANGQRQNPYINEGMAFHYFFTRKVMLSFSSRIYLFFPGGFGTLDEFFEIVCLAQTEKIEPPFTIIVVGRDFWTPLLKWVDDALYEEFATISKEDQDLYHLVDTADAAYKIISTKKTKR